VSGRADFTVPNPSAFDHQSVIAEWKVSDTNPDVIDLGPGAKWCGSMNHNSIINGGHLDISARPIVISTFR
jgi:hypothetical protein